MKRLAIDTAGSAQYFVAKDKEGNPLMVSLDLDKVFGFTKLGDMAQKAIAFAVGHVLRNSTAGKMDDVDAAHKAAQERAATLMAGAWAAHREAGETGESRESLLAQALAAVMQCSASDAAAFISAEIGKALEEKDIDPQAELDDLTDEQKKERRKIAATIRKSIGDDPAVSVAMSELKLERQKADMDTKKKAAEGKKSAFA